MWPLTISAVPMCREAWIVTMADKWCSLMETFHAVSYTHLFFIPTFLLFVIAMVVFGRNAEQRLISQEQKVLESTDTNLSLVVNNICLLYTSRCV